MTAKQDINLLRLILEFLLDFLFDCYHFLLMSDLNSLLLQLHLQPDNC